MSLIITLLAELENSQAIIISILWTLIIFAFTRGKTFNTDAVNEWVPIICDGIAIVGLGMSLLIINLKLRKKLDNETEMLESTRRLKLVLE
ncbi:hypothetical protein H70357_31090 [Paenibacillus sp. FSL H7-0357]|nr:hypothetical protein H70357_31090 [Paenibacillus sp. FSL H7-0357]